MSILVTGCTGFIGKELISVLLNRGDSLWLLTRNSSQKICKIFSQQYPTQCNFIESLDNIPTDADITHIINLAGEPLANGRWNEKRKTIYINSRREMTRNVIALITRLSNKPKQLINGSAIGFYGPNDNSKLDETAKGMPSFSHTLCQQWENEAETARKFGVAVCAIRIGIVLDNGGGSLPELTKTCKWRFAVSMGNGQQWMSWIHRDDLVTLILFAMQKLYNDPVNGTAPNPMKHSDFIEALASAYRCWITLPFPAWFVRLLFGEMADELLLSGQRVIPRRALEDGFQFKYAQLSDALDNIIKTKTS